MWSWSPTMPSLRPRHRRSTVGSTREVGWTALLGPARGTPDVSAYVAASRAEDLTGLPPIFLDVGSAETFRDEVVHYAGRIWQAGARATRLDWLRRVLTD